MFVFLNLLLFISELNICWQLRLVFNIQSIKVFTINKFHGNRGIGLNIYWVIDNGSIPNLL